MASFGKVLFGGSRVLFWALVPFVVGGALAITLHLVREDTRAALVILACDAAGLLLLMSLWPYHRIPYVRRVLTALVGAVFGVYLIAGWVPDLIPSKDPAPGRLETLAGFVEHLWAELLALTDGEATLHVSTPPVYHDGVAPEELTIPVNEIEDWEVALPDGTYAGGYATRAMCAHAKRERLPIPREIEERLARNRE